MKSNRTLSLIGLLLLAAVLLIGFFNSGEPEKAPVPFQDRLVMDDLEPSEKLAKPPVQSESRTLMSSANSGGVIAKPNGAERDKLSASLLQGRAIDEAGVPLPGLVVRLVREPIGILATTDDDGYYSFDELELGEYHLLLDFALLPDGFLAPWKLRFPHDYPGGTPYGYGTILRIERHAEYTIDLGLYRAATITGHLFDRNNQPIAGASIAVAAEGESRYSARTDGNGRYHMAYVYPGHYTLFATINESNGIADGNAPLPVALNVKAGMKTLVPDIIAGVGGHVAFGRVIDQDEKPVSGVLVVCHESEFLINPLRLMARTDADGRFRIGRLPRSDFTLDIGQPDALDSSDRVPVATLATPIWFKTLDADEEVDIGEIRVHNNHPFSLTVNADIEAAWAADQGLGFDNLLIDVRRLSDGVVLKALESRHRGRPGADSEGRMTIKLTFVWSQPTPHAEVKVVARLGSEPERQFEVVPTPDGEQTFHLTYP
ncbi:MAG: hypothetical protein ACI8TQ_003775 [Planctomycetota bacterium]|jgi:hypothetical protein